jgi:hypothetical protein
MARSRKNRTSKPSTGPEHPFIEGTPLDEHGMPDDGAEVPIEDTDHVPVDSKSSRIAAEFKNAVSRKSKGEKGIEFNAPDPVKYNGIVLAQPQALVRFAQTTPKRDDNIDEQPVASLKNYELLRRYVRDNYWNGEEAVYVWDVHSGKYPYASGTLHFREDEMRRHGYQQPPQMPPQQQQPYGAPQQYGMQPPPYGAPQTYGMPPPYGMQPYPQQPYPQQPQVFVQQPGPQQPQAQQPQQQQPPPPPAPMPPVQVPAGTDPIVAMMLQMLMQQLSESRTEIAQMRAERWQAQQGYAPQYMQGTPTAPAATAVAAAPVTPKSPLEQLGEMSAMVKQVVNFGNDMAQQFAPDGSEAPDPKAVTPPPLNDENFPLMVKDFGAARAVATKDGEVSFPFFANIDKWEGILDGVVGKVTKALDKIADKRTQSMREQVEIMERAEVVATRAGVGRAPQALPNHQPQQNYQPATQHHQPQQQNYQPVSQAPPTPPPAKKPTEHPWNKFASELAADRVEPAAKPPSSEPPAEPVVAQRPTAVQPPAEPPNTPPAPVQVVETTAEVAD